MPEAQRRTSCCAEDIPLEVVYRDDDVIVIDKPAGLVTHPAPGHQSGTLVNALLGMEAGEGGAGAASAGVGATRHRAPPGPGHQRPDRGRPQ